MLRLVMHVNLLLAAVVLWALAVGSPAGSVAMAVASGAAAELLVAWLHLLPAVHYRVGLVGVRDAVIVAKPQTETSPWTASSHALAAGRGVRAAASRGSAGAQAAVDDDLEVWSFGEIDLAAVQGEESVGGMPPLVTNISYNDDFGWSVTGSSSAKRPQTAGDRSLGTVSVGDFAFDFDFALPLPVPPPRAELLLDDPSPPGPGDPAVAWGAGDDEESPQMYTNSMPHRSGSSSNAAATTTTGTPSAIAVKPQQLRDGEVPAAEAQSAGASERQLLSPASLSAAALGSILLAWLCVRLLPAMACSASSVVWVVLAADCVGAQPAVALLLRHSGKI
jgi:hypothetical protein